MNKMFKLTRSTYARVAALPVLALASVAAHATGPLDAAFAAVDLSGVAVSVGAATLLIIGIALVFKGPALAKRVIRQV